MAQVRVISPIPHYLQFCRFLYLPFDINKFRRFIFAIFIVYFSNSRKFGSSTFERSLKSNSKREPF